MSSVVTLSVASPVTERGWARMEYWYNPSPGLGAFEGSVTDAQGHIKTYLTTTYGTAPDYTRYEPAFEGNSQADAPPGYPSRLTAWFYPPTTGLYTFYVNGSGQSDLFVSTNSSAANAVLVAQETGWSNPWQWTTANAGSASTKCSATWTAPDGATPWSAGIHMTAGQPYYVALIHQSASGGNNCEATFTAYGAPAPANGVHSAMTRNLIASYAPRSFDVTFTQPPANTNVPFGGLAAFYASATTDSSSYVGEENNPAKEWTNANYLVTYQWLVNGALIPGANGRAFTFGPVSPLDNGAQIVCQARSLGYVNGSLQDIWQSSPPATLTVAGNAVYEPGFALHEYWSLNPGVSAAVAGQAGAPTWYMATPAFEVGINGAEVTDNFTDELVGFFIPPTTGLYTFYDNSDDDSALFLSTSSSTASKIMVAQETGYAPALNWAASSANAAQVASSTFVDANGATPFANGIQLQGGQKYFMQMIHHQGGGGTESCATETPFGQPAPANGAVSVIRGALLGTYVPACAYVTVTNQPQNLTAPAYGTAMFTAGGATDSVVPIGPETDWRASSTNFLCFQWYKNGTAVAGATTSALSLTNVLPSDNGSTIQCIMRPLGYVNAQGNPLWATSSAALLNVIVPGAAPTLIYPALYTNYATQNFPSYNYAPVTYVDVAFSGAMDPVALLNVNNYVFSSGSGLSAANITGITVNSNSFREVELALNQSPRTPFTVTVNGMNEAGGGPALSGSATTAVNTIPLTCLDIAVIPSATLSGVDPAVPTTMYVDGPGAYTVQCEGSDIWNRNDGFNFLYEAKTGSFDVVVRQVETTHVSNWTQGGLMIRETLDPDSREWSIVNDPDAADGIQAVDGSGYGANTVECKYRPSYAAVTTSWQQVAPPQPPAYPNAWVRLSLQRITNGTTAQDLLTAYNSTNGFHWQQLAQMDAATNGGAGPLPDPIYVGICSMAHDNDNFASGIYGQYIATEAYADYNSSSAGAQTLEPGWAKMEYWYNPNPGLNAFHQSVTNAQGHIQNYLVSSYPTPPNYTIYEPAFEGNSHADTTPNFTSRLTAWFYPPTTGRYTFYVNGDDQSDLFVSTDSTAGNAVMVAQESGWSNPWQWTTANAGSASTKCSATWTAADGATPWSAGIPMTAGQPYYVALIHQDTGGGNNCEATFTAYGAQAPSNGIYSAMTGNLIATPAPRSLNVTFTQPPANTNVPFGSLATFSASATTDSTSHMGDENNPADEWTNVNCLVAYQWSVNGALIPGATGSTFSFGPVSPLDNGAQIACQARALGYVDNGFNDLWASTPTATLTVTGNAVYEPGFVLHEYWSQNPGVSAVEAGQAGAPTWYMAAPAFEADIYGTEVADNFTDELVGFFTPPTTDRYTFYDNSDDDSDLFLSPTTSAANKVKVAQEIGWASALNWTASSANAAQVASSTFLDANGATPFVNGIPLQADQKYFMQLVHHQGGGFTESCVTETPFGQPAPAPGALSVMRGALVGTYVPACDYVTVTSNPQSLTVPAYGTATFIAGGATDSVVPIGPETDWRASFTNFLCFQWYKNGTAVAGATSSALVLTNVLPSDNGSTIQCAMRALGYANAQGTPLWATSSAASLNVITGAPPTLAYAALYTNYATQNFPSYSYAPVTYVDVAFSGAMDPVALLNVNNYVFSAGSGLSAANITGITVDSNSYREVELALNASPRLPFTVSVNGMKAEGGGPALAGAAMTNVNTVPLTCLDIGVIPSTTLSGVDPAAPTAMYVDGPGAYTVQCEGSDIWNRNDGFNFLYEAKTGSFDVVVRQVETTHVSNWTQGGLMIRETLDPYSREWSIVNDPDAADGIQALDGSGYGANTTECKYRPSYAAVTTSWQQVAPPQPPAYPNAWVRLSLQRITNGTTAQDLLTAYSSTNGFIWRQLAQMDAATNGGAGPLPDPIYVGICSIAHDNDPPVSSYGQYIANISYAYYNSSFITITSLPRLSIVKSAGGTLTISWAPAEGTLESSPAITGPLVNWQPVGAANPAVIPITGSAQYFRVVVSP